MIGWEKDGSDYFAVINEQEESPVVPMHDIYIDVKKPDKKAVLLRREQSFRQKYLVIRYGFICRRWRSSR